MALSSSSNLVDSDGEPILLGGGHTAFSAKAALNVDSARASSGNFAGGLDPFSAFGLRGSGSEYGFLEEGSLDNGPFVSSGRKKRGRSAVGSSKLGGVLRRTPEDATAPPAKRRKILQEAQQLLKRNDIPLEELHQYMDEIQLFQGDVMDEHSMDGEDDTAKSSLISSRVEEKKITQNKQQGFPLGSGPAKRRKTLKAYELFLSAEIIKAYQLLKRKDFYLEEHSMDWESSFLFFKNKKAAAQFSLVKDKQVVALCKDKQHTSPLGSGLRMVEKPSAKSIADEER